MLSGQLLLNEIMSYNATRLADQFNEYPDWIEIYNSGENAVDLKEYWLSDDVTNLKRWKLPPMELFPDEYLVVFASGRDISNSMPYWHTVVDLGEVWRYYLPKSVVADDWKTSLSFTSNWQSGASGIGYGDNDDATVIPKTISVYLQKEFQVSSTELIEDAALFIDYDDGFVAYLNGVEIARSYNMGDSGRVVNFNAPAGSGREAVMFNGLPPEVFYFTDALHLLKEGSNVLAIEVHNENASSSDLTAIPFLLLAYSTYQEGLTFRNHNFVVKEKFPHTNFKIKSEGEGIFLSNDKGTIIDMLMNTPIPRDFSYGRVPDSAGLFGYFEQPTPGAVNGTNYSTDYIADSVKIYSYTKDNAFPLRILMESKVAEDRIYYTLDGSEPTRQSLVFRGYVELKKTTVFKARIYRSNSVPGPVTTRTFFVGDGHELPVISVSMNPYDLWDYNNGIYAMGPNANQEAPHHGANFWNDWERHAYFEIYNENHELVLAQDAGTKIFGGWSRAHPQKSQSFFARNEYGTGKFSYPLFKERAFDTYESFVLRNNGNDWCNGLFRDALSASLAAEMGVDHQAYQPYVMYLNGEYWGIINMREKVNEHFIASNHNVYSEDVNILMGGNGSLVHGSPDSYKKMYDYVTTNNLSEWQFYNTVKSMMDVHNYIKYWVLNVYIDNKDWPGNNIKYWSTNAPGSLYRWISYDTDFGYSIWDQRAYQYNTLEFSFGEGPVSNWANQPSAVAMIKSLLSNQSFKHQFINEFADRMNTTFHPDQAIPVIDSFQQRLLSEAPAHYDKWIGDPNNWLSFPNWLNSVERMRIYFRERPAYMREQLIRRFNLEGTSEIKVNVSDTVAGYVRINGTDLSRFPSEGIYFNKIPIRLQAIPAPGYHFSHWVGTYPTDTAAFVYGMEGEGEFIAVFEPVDSVVKIVINEINFASHVKKNTEDWIELYNHSGVAADLSGWMVGDGYTPERYVIPGGTVIPAGGYMVFARNLPDFKRFYPELKPVKGNLPFELDSQKDGVALYDPEGALHDYVIYQDVAPWPETATGTGFTMELINPLLDNAKPQSWKASLVQPGTPCALNSQYSDVITGVEKMDLKRSFFRAYPSPFEHETTIDFSIATTREVRISVYSATGSLIEIIADGSFEAGDHKLTWRPDSGLAEGLYFINVRSESEHTTLKVVYRR